ncbi:unnamed protein product [Diatraea saccharalis]|uniref:Uncharacterized protein n=1 Tax=Diatraea saccharalis TaxID=40085 RepID=A0A9N9R5T3_9NEOP|nr:unnamed protein product [Diatraea saccharalis]
MKRHKKNVFAEKFRLLNSQGSTEEINWSSSDSNEFENISTNVDKLHKVSHTRKRKRKQKVPKNISNLSVTFVDASKTTKDAHNTNLEVSENSEKDAQSSPILGNIQYFPPYKASNVTTSPVLIPKVIAPKSKVENSLKSPILILKAVSPKVSPKVKKKLFNFASSNYETYTSKLTNKSTTNNCLDRRKLSNELCHLKSQSSNEGLDQNHTCVKALHSNEIILNNDKTKHSICLVDDFKINNIKQELNENDKQNINYTIQETPELNLDDSMAMLKTNSKDLAKKVKSYLDCDFSSETASQITISDLTTPNNSSKASDDIEIISTITQVPSNRNSSESIQELPEDMNKKEKKLKYRKDGLAYRLNNLLKKQTASTSLWQHERFMAANSNFVIPKGEYKPFRICKQDFKYGSYLLETMDFNDDKFLILINKSFVSYYNIKVNAILKLYEPYKIIEFNDDCKLILNVCKFECVEIDDINI